MTRDQQIANAGGLASGLSRNLELAAMESLPEPQRLMYGRMVWTCWQQLCVAMTGLEQKMPKSSTQGYDWADRARDIQEQSR